MTEFEVFLQGGSPWGFRLQGGREFRLPLRIARVEGGGKADIGGIKVGDHVLEINEQRTDTLYHTEALSAIKKASYSLSLVLMRTDETNGADKSPAQSTSNNFTQSARISVRVGGSNPTSPRATQSSASPRSPTTTAPSQVSEVVRTPPQAAQEVFAGVDEDAWFRNADSTRPNTESTSNAAPQTRGRPTERTKSISSATPSAGGPRHLQSNNSQSQQPQSGARQRTKSEGRAPDWYKQMYKEINHSMSGESHLTKLLSNDARRGAFRKYDGASSTPTTPRGGSSPVQQRKNEAPVDPGGVARRLGAGRNNNVNTSQHRKSMPDITAVFTNSNGVTMRDKSKNTGAGVQNSWDASAREKRNSVHSDWYKAMQKGGEIPLTGLRSPVTVQPVAPKQWSYQKPVSLVDKPVAQQAPPPTVAPKTTRVNTDKIKAEYNKPADFLELRRRELQATKAMDSSSPSQVSQVSAIAREKEFVRQQREKTRREEDDLQRHVEEERLRKIQAERDKRQEEDRRVQREQQEQKRMLQEQEERAEMQRRKLQEEARVAREWQERESRVLRERQEREAVRLAAEQEERRKQRLEEEQANALSLPEFATAVYSFAAQGPNELTFRKNARIQLLRRVDENWMEGACGDQIGIFPVNYVKMDPKPEPVVVAPAPHVAAPIAEPVAVAPIKKEVHPEPEPKITIAPVEPVEQPMIAQFEISVQSAPDEPEEFAQQNGTVDPSVVENSLTNGHHHHNGDDLVDAQLLPEEDLEQQPVQLQIEEGLAKGRYTFKAETENELSFRKGQLITLLRRIDENWLEGELDDAIGIFPSNYVVVMQEPRIIEAAVEAEVETAVEVAPIEAAPVETAPAKPSIESLKASLKQEQLIAEDAYSPVIELAPLDSAPAEDIFEAHSKAAAALESDKPVIDSNGIDSNGIDSNGINSNGIDSGIGIFMDDFIGQGDPHRTVFPYRPTNEDEVELCVGDVILVLEKCEDGWFVGTSQRTGAFGTFPGNYVQPIEAA